ncbi:MAG: transketolase [Epulopiscium sp. Nuni2H_MBin003]|nr:MAG: transketolase [Epulopiscium sp. Nuni2H_MBin003]
MRVILSNHNGTDVCDMRDAFCDSLIKLAEKNKDIILMDADLMAAMGTKPFLQKFPERTINCGIQEANMIGVACGLSVQGKIPFAHTFAPFATRRACDQIFISGAYNNANVKIIGSDPGITASYNGGTHMPFEDMGIMRIIPTMTVIEPCDIISLTTLLPKIAAHKGMVYMRLVRKDVNRVYGRRSEFEIGKGNKLKSGTDATIIASGYCVAEAINASKILEAEGIKVSVIDMFTWKPIDAELIIEEATKTGAIVTAENHNVVNGLGSAVAEVLVKNKPVPMEMIGVQDEFGEVGPVSYLRERFEMRDVDIAEAVRRVIKRKSEVTQ